MKPTPATVSASPPPCGRAPPPSASFLLALRPVRARASGARRSAPRRAPATSAGATFSAAAIAFEPLVLLVEIAARRLAGQRLDAPHARRRPRFRDTTRRGRYRRWRDMGAAAQFDRIRLAGLGAVQSPCPSTRRAPRRHISRRTAPSRLRRSLHRPHISRVVTGSFCRTISLAIVLDLLASPPASSAWDARSRSAAGPARPASPSARHGCRAPGAAPRAADGSPNGWRGAGAARMIDLKLDRVADLDRALVDLADMDEQVAQPSSACRSPRCGSPRRRWCRDRRSGRRTRRRTASG